MDLDGSQRLESGARQHAPDGSEQIEIVIEVQLWVQTADDVHVGELPGSGVFQSFSDLRDCECIGPLRLILTPERTEPTLVFADVRGVQVQTVHIVDVSVMHAPANSVGLSHQFGGVRLLQQPQRLFR